MPGVKGTLEEFKNHTLHSGSKTGPVVKSRAQALAIGLSEERKEGHPVKKHHSFASSDAPSGHATTGKPNQHEQPVGHKVEAGRHSEMDGAGRKGHDESGHRSYSEHKTPHHPAGSHTVQGYIPPGEGVAGHPGEVMRMAHDGGNLLGDNYSQKAHEPAVLKHAPGPAGGIGTTAGMGTKPHGYGHAAHQRRGNLRVSGHPGGHQVGKR
jgi:hypothetical protein